MASIKVLITEATNRIGEAITRHLKSETDYELILLSSIAGKLPDAHEFTLIPMKATNAKELKNLCYERKPDFIINTAAFMNVDQCEENRKFAWDLNVGVTENLASICRVIDSHLICLSSDYVFDGMKGPYTEEDRPNPLNYFGKTMHTKENTCLTNLVKSTVVRTSAPYGYSSFGRMDFIKWLLAQFDKGKDFSVADGLYCNPVLTDDVALAIARIIQKKRTGIYHTGGADWLNRYYIAVTTAKIFGFNPQKINPIPVIKLNQITKRPEKAGLVTLKSETDLNMKFSSLESGLITFRHHMIERSKVIFKYS